MFGWCNKQKQKHDKKYLFLNKELQIWSGIYYMTKKISEEERFKISSTRRVPIFFKL